MAISMLKIRRPLGRLIFNMGIAIPGKTVFLIETAPWFCHHNRHRQRSHRHHHSNQQYLLSCHPRHQHILHTNLIITIIIIIFIIKLEMLTFHNFIWYSSNSSTPCVFFTILQLYARLTWLWHVHLKIRAPSQYKDRLIYVWRFPC